MNPDPYSLSGPFYLNDRISPDGANDLDEVRRLDVALHARRGEAPPARVRPQSAVLEDLVHYQSLRGLKPDGAARRRRHGSARSRRCWRTWSTTSPCAV